MTDTALHQTVLESSFKIIQIIYFWKFNTQTSEESKEKVKTLYAKLLFQKSELENDKRRKIRFCILKILIKTFKKIEVTLFYDYNKKLMIFDFQDS